MSKKNITIGIICENHRDLIVLQSFFTRIVGDSYNSTFKEYLSEGPIIGNCKADVQLALGDDKADLAIVCSDYDKNGDKCKKVNEIMRKLDSSEYYNRIIKVCPQKTIEGWLLYDEQALRNHLSLSKENAIPHPKLHNKDRFEQIIAEKNKDETMTPTKYARLIANTAQIETLIQDKSFKQFYDGIKSAINYIK